ncbi:hypothetical protein [Rhizobium sullae]|uniref:hypothetical protein n=1 Tax=Rhizobium sullae TaxID=50338 RepID=UPI000B34FDDE|nr:hypothetical protein [Rhizobium sullae]
MNEENLYLDAGAKQGHLLALKAQLVAKAKGKLGISAIPAGLIGFVPLFFSMLRAVRRGDKSRFT